jgi:hypothetical protein
MEQLHLDLQLNGATLLMHPQHQQAAPMKPTMQGSFIPKAPTAQIKSDFQVEFDTVSCAWHCWNLEGKF